MKGLRIISLFLCFENLIKYGTIDRYEEIIRIEIRKEVERLAKTGIDINNFEALEIITQYEQRIQKEFKTLLEKKQQQENIPDSIQMSLNYRGQILSWELNIENTEMINDYFERLATRLRRREEIYPN